ncbi:ribonucleoside-diphosphate reductase, adenosylcobalamin-dependent, partial [bacterium]|nr:ribonucleoside-diphosphate reductase, adenosylcobalamin-dependent [bacterium]
MARLPKKIRKRDNSLVGFDKQKIERAIFRAALEALADEKKAAHTADISTEKVLERVTEAFKDKIPSVEEIQDIVEEVLMQEGLSSVARSYILYREEHQDIRQVKVICGVRDDLKLPLNTLFVLKKRYLLKDDEKNIVETPRELFRRIAGCVSEGEANFKSKRNKN